MGIDYALFIVTRHRQGLIAGHDPETSIVDGGEHLGPGRAVRRHHRLHRPSRHVRPGRVVPLRPGRRRRPRRGPHHDRRADPAPRPPRVHRAAGPVAPTEGEPGQERTPHRRHRDQGVLAALGRHSSSAGRSFRRSSPWCSSWSSPSRSSPCASARRTRGTIRWARRRARPTTCWPRASVQGSTARSSSWPSSTTPPTRARSARVVTDVTAQPGVARVAPPDAHPGPRRHRGGPRQRLSHERARRTRPPPPSSTTCGSQTIPAAVSGSTLDRPRRRDDGDLHRLRPRTVGQAAPVHRSGRPVVVPAALGGLPEHRDPSGVGGHEHLVHRSGLRDPGGRLPMGLARLLFGVNRAGPSRGVPAGDVVRHPLRSVHGLPGLPGHPDPRGVAEVQGTTASRSATGWRQRARPSPRRPSS